MSCWRKDVLRDGQFRCQEMEARIMELEDGGESCFCLGVVDHAHRQTGEHSKRLCIVDNTEDGLDIVLDLTDVDVASLQATLSGGMLAIYQRARGVSVER